MSTFAKDVIAFYFKANAQGWRINAWHLTPEQREALEYDTGQTATLLGYPVTERAI